MINKTNNGITIIEILIAIAVISIISSIVVLNLSKFRNEQALKNTTIDIVSLLNKAKQNTLSSINSNSYGVHFETDKITLFVAPTYSSGTNTNEVSIFSTTVKIPTSGGINVGGGSDVIFERLTGETIGGTIIVQQKSNVSRQKTITISKTGIISSN